MEASRGCRLETGAGAAASLDPFVKSLRQLAADVVGATWSTMTTGEQQCVQGDTKDGRFE